MLVVNTLFPNRNQTPCFNQSACACRRALAKWRPFTRKLTPEAMRFTPAGPAQGPDVQLNTVHAQLSTADSCSAKLNPPRRRAPRSAALERAADRLGGARRKLATDRIHRPSFREGTESLRSVQGVATRCQRALDAA